MTLQELLRAYEFIELKPALQEVDEDFDDNEAGYKLALMWVKMLEPKPTLREINVQAWSDDPFDYSIWTSEPGDKNAAGQAVEDSPWEELIGCSVRWSGDDINDDIYAVARILYHMTERGFNPNDVQDCLK